MRIISLIILAIYMVFFWYNAFTSDFKNDKIASFALFVATCIPFFYILNRWKYDWYKRWDKKFNNNARYSK